MHQLEGYIPARHSASLIDAVLKEVNSVSDQTGVGLEMFFQKDANMLSLSEEESLVRCMWAGVNNERYNRCNNESSHVGLNGVIPYTQEHFLERGEEVLSVTFGVNAEIGEGIQHLKPSDSVIIEYAKEGRIQEKRLRLGEFESKVKGYGTQMFTHDLTGDYGNIIGFLCQDIEKHESDNQDGLMYGTFRADVVINENGLEILPKSECSITFKSDRSAEKLLEDGVSYVYMVGRELHERISPYFFQLKLNETLPDERRTGAWIMASYWKKDGSGTAAQFAPESLEKMNKVSEALIPIIEKHIAERQIPLERLNANW